MKNLLIFKKGAAVINKNSIHKIEIDGEKPIKVQRANSKNTKKHFKGDIRGVLETNPNKKSSFKSDVK